MLTLRPYQIDIINQARALMSGGCKSILIQAPTGSGKTALTAHMLHTAANKGMRSLFIVHRRELIKQSANAFKKEGIDYGIISAGFEENRNHRVQLASVQTLARRLSRYIQPSFIVWDEAHHVASGSWTKIFKDYNSCYHIGLTATPERLDGKGLGQYFKAMVCGPSTQALIAQGFLSPYKLFAPSQLDMSSVHIRMGDFDKKEMAAKVNKPSITGNVIEHYKRLCDGKRAIVFCASIQHSKHVVEQFNQNNIPAEHVDGGTSEEERDNAIERFKAGSSRVLSNVELFGEGFDVPAIEATILLRPTQSLGLYLQQIGRGLRPFEWKTETIILDHVGNWQRHGLPDDEREWSLQGRDGRSTAKNGGANSVQLCPKCFAAQTIGSSTCKYCGDDFPIKSREISEREGDLEEIRREAIRKQMRRQQGSAQTEEELYRIGVARGYRHPRAWAHFVFQGRQLKRFRP